MKTKQAARIGPSPVPNRRRMAQQFRALEITQARAALLRCLLRDARLERCMQLVP